MRTHLAHPHHHFARRFPLCVCLWMCACHYSNQRDYAPSLQTSGPAQAYSTQSKSLSRQAAPRSPLFCSVRDLPYCCSRSSLSCLISFIVHLAVQIASLFICPCDFSPAFLISQLLLSVCLFVLAILTMITMETHFGNCFCVCLCVCIPLFCSIFLYFSGCLS